MGWLMRSAPYMAVLAATAYFYHLATHFDFNVVPGRLGPDVWPKAILILLGLTCIYAIVRAAFVREAHPPAPDVMATPHSPTGAMHVEAATEVAATAPGPSYPLLTALGMGLFLAYPIAIEHVGFVVATFVLMIAFMYIGRWRNHLAIWLTGTLGTLALFYIFRGLVHVSLPLGTGPFKEFTIWVAVTLRMW